MAAAGDLLVHEPLTAQAAADARAAGEPGHDFTQVLAAVKPTISSADLAVCHMEQPLAKPTGPFTGWPYFSAPPELADAAAAVGFDTCSTASNHSLDTGEAGIARTLAALDRVHVRHAGTARTEAEAETPNIIDVRGVKVAQLSYTFSFNTIERPAGRPWVANMLDPDAIIAEARHARKLGAEVVLVSLHWGTEYQHAPDSAQLSQVKKLLASPDIDLILGCHAHVVQPMERIGDKWVVYGMGNEVAWQPQRQDTRDGFMARFTFTEVSPGRFRVTKAEAIPTFMSLSGSARLVNLPDALANPRLPASQRSAYRTSWQRTRGYLLSRGAGAAGLVVVGSA